MRARRTVKERDIVKILVFGYDRTLIKSIRSGDVCGRLLSA